MDADLTIPITVARQNSEYRTLANEGAFKFGEKPITDNMSLGIGGSSPVNESPYLHELHAEATFVDIFIYVH